MEPRTVFLWNYWLDRLLPLLMVAVLFAYCWLMSPKKELWVDEGYSLSLVADPSFSHAMTALYGAADGGLPVYYVLANAWAHLFGTGLLTLRLFSSLCVALAVLVLWTVLRQCYSVLAAAIAILAVALNSSLLLYHDTELRFYGIFLLCAALVLLAHQRLSCTAPTWKQLLTAWGAHTVLVYSHPFGILYSGAALLGMASAEHMRPRWKLYLLLATSWLTLLPWLPAIGRVHDLGRPHNWVERPTLADVFSVYSTSLRYALLAVVILACLAVLSPADRGNVSQKKTVPILPAQSLAYALLPLPVAMVSWAAMPVFVDRYFLPSVLGIAVLFSHVAERMLQRIRRTALMQAGLVELLVALLAIPIVTAARAPKAVGFQTIAGIVGTKLPVLVENANLFLPLDYYGDPRVHPYYYVLDWESALHSPSMHATVQTKIMMRIRAEKYHPGRIIGTPDALCRSDRFLLLHNSSLSWFYDHIDRNPAFVKERVDSISKALGPEESAWLVTRIGVPQECSAR